MCFFSSRRRHTRCALVTGVQTCALPIFGRAYEYRIVNRRAPLTWDKGLSWQVARPLDADAMHAAAQQLIGLHDFTTFRSAHCQSQSPVKTLDKLTVSRHGEDIIIEAAEIGRAHV